MSITRVIAPLASERILQLSPPNSTAAAVTWLRRPNLFPGRALTAPTLDARQQWAAGHVVQRAQAFTPGIVEGLEVGYAIAPAPAPNTRQRVTLHIAAGRGLAASGEDVWLARDIEVDFYGLPVVAPPSDFDPNAAADDDTPPGGLRERKVGPTLGSLLDTNPTVLPRAGILLLQPVFTDRAAIDPNDPCDRCCTEGNISFEDWRLCDAVRLLWYAWPGERYGLPAAAPNRMRNGLAYTVFDAERALGPDETLPWESFGVPVALLGVDANFVPLFADRGAVARHGGRAQVSRLESFAPGVLKPRPRLAPLWQAQIEQFAEQIAEMGDPTPAPAALAAAFRKLPPFGLLPTSAYDLTAKTSAFFPAGFDIDAVPVPVEQLDLAVRESAPLAPLDLSLGERVRILVPVSQASYEPRLLLTETIDPEFQHTLEHFVTVRARALGARQSLRNKAAVLENAITAVTPDVPAITADPLALEPEALAPWGPPPDSGGHVAALAAGNHQHFFDSASATITPAAGNKLCVWAYLDPDNPPRELMLQWNSGGWEHRAYWGENLIEWGVDGTVSRMQLGDMPPLGQWLRLEVPAAAVGLEGKAINGMAFTLFDGQAAFGPAGQLNTSGGEVPWFAESLPTGALQHGNYPWRFLTRNEMWGPFEPACGVEPSEAQNGRSTVFAGLQANQALKDVLSTAELAQLHARGLEGFIAYLKSRADRADDVVDFTFVKAQTDIYRVRQLVLNTTAATRLAVSPTLAGIAQAETAVATQQRISTFFKEMKDTKFPPTPHAAAAKTRTATTYSAPATGTASGSTINMVLMGNLFGAVGGASNTSSAGKTEVKTAPPHEAPFFLNFNFAAPATEIKAIPPIGVFSGFEKAVEVVNAQPLVGAADLRTMSIADRLDEPGATAARNYAAASRHEAIASLVRLADELTAEDKGVTPGLFEDLDVYGLEDDAFLPAKDASATNPLVNRRLSFKHFLAPATRAAKMSSLLSLPTRNNADEGVHFSDAVGVTDNTVALMRQVEGRVKLYRNIIATCQQALATLRDQLRTARTREAMVSENLAEARHDVAVTRALISEEQARLDAINARRAAILANEVRFLAFTRPRTTEHLSAAPLRNVDPGLIDPPVPACLRSTGDVPEEISTMLTVVREAPASWFLRTPVLLDKLDRVDHLLKVVQSAQVRTQVNALRYGNIAAGNGCGTNGCGSTALVNVHTRQLQMVAMARAATLSLDINRMSSLGWRGARDAAVEVVSLGDLIDGEHGRGSVAREAAEFFEQVSRICSCLHAEFSAVPPSIRLDWAEVLSQFDTAPSLRNLASLARWSELNYVDRKQMQAYADWLFAQINANEPRAEALMNDVVRMCLLLASHAPVNRIITGRLPRPVTATPGARIPLLPIDASKVKVGMHALIYRAEQLVARAVLEDVGGKELSAKVIHTAGASVALDETARVHFAEAAMVSFAAKTKRILGG